MVKPHLVGTMCLGQKYMTVLKAFAVKHNKTIYTKARTPRKVISLRILSCEHLKAYQRNCVMSMSDNEVIYFAKLSTVFSAISSSK